MKTTFTLKSGNTYNHQDNGYCFVTDANGKKTRCSFASFKMAYDQFVIEENTRQNEANTFTNIDPIAEAFPEQIAEDILDAMQAELDASPSRIGLGDAEHEGLHMDMTPEEEAKAMKEAEEWLEAEDAKRGKKPTKRTNKRPSKNTVFGKIFTLANGEKVDVCLTAKQVDFVKHLPDTNFWESGLDSCVWTDILCDEIKGQFAGKPMTVGAMISTLCEKGLGSRAKERVNNRKATSFALTELGKLVAAELGLS